MRTNEEQGWTVLVFTFWSDNQIVGMAALKMKKILYTNNVYSLADDVYSDFVFRDEYREACMKLLVDAMFNELKCKSATITLDTNSPNFELLEKMCIEKKLPVRREPHYGRAVISIETSWEKFYNSLNRNTRKEFRRIERKLNDLGSWKISCRGINDDVIKEIFAIDQKSWKADWRAEKNMEEDTMLRIILDASKQTENIKPVYESEVWFLEVNGTAVAYQIVQYYKDIAVFVKTSYNKDFNRVSPGKFLINNLIREVFKKGTVTKIDFVTNLSFVRVWNPLCEGRTNVIVGKTPLLLQLIQDTLRQARIIIKKSFLINNQIVLNVLKIVESRIQI